MAFRERVKRALGRNSSSKSSSASSTLSKNNSKSDSSVWYQPGEPLPMPKYRRPVAKEHKEKLESFNFEKAWRRRSDQSMYSPMGSRYPSRRNSLTSRKSMNGPRRQVIEDINDAGDVSNVGLGQRTRESTRLSSVALRSEQCSGSDPSTSSRSQTGTTNSSSALGQSFTQQELNLALQRSNLELPHSAS
ncbi:srsf protein kinase 1 [Diplodia corticola]|uniref:Srsf protein kinase 1 n=1 Tax=Diplodia corticola TaxID=236234 RepID=A0A1J9RRD4_9PEZI|nr:srsf protein kinase 1 [Diplodia corticola]OJD30085.1 srsf protein kinase 1 [Diplodia corticola]